MAISTKAQSLMPDIISLRAISQSLALLDAILSPAWGNRYYSFDAHWGVQQAIASMRDGEGDSYVVWFTIAGVVLKGFAHESQMSPYRVSPPQIWPGIFDSVPGQLSGILAESAFMPGESTFCLWRTFDDASWQQGNVKFPDGHDPDGSARLLKILDGKPQTYQRWAEEYYDKPLDLEAITHIYDHRVLTDDVVARLNPNLSVDELAIDLNEIGYRHTL